MQRTAAVLVGEGSPERGRESTAAGRICETGELSTSKTKGRKSDGYASAVN